MGVRIAGFWDLEWNTPIKEIDKWKFMNQDFMVNKFYMTPVSGIINPTVFEFNNFDEILHECNIDGYTPVYVDERSTVPLTTFQHPENALYIFGKARYNPVDQFKTDSDLWVRIDTPSGSPGLLWGDQVAAIILYDRHLKGL